MRDNDKVIKVAKIISAIFNPFVVPFLAFLVLFFCSYLSMLPLTYRLIVLGIVYAFTILLPMIAIFFFRKINGWGFGAFRDRKKRFVPYLLTIICYVSCLVMMIRIGLPRYMTGIILATLMAMVICIVVNMKKENGNDMPFKADEVNWDELSGIGIMKDELELSGEMDTLLRGEKTKVMSLSLVLLGVDVVMDATLQLVRKGESPLLEIQGVTPLGK
jgi:hypothetical protein